MQPDIRLAISNLKLSHPEILQDEEAWLSALESETDMKEILTTIVRRIEDSRAFSDGTDERLRELKARRDRFEHRIETLRELAFKVMQAAELAKIELPEATLSLRAGQQQLVGERDPLKTPDMFCKITRDIDRAKIKEHLKSGGELPGFTLSNSPPSLMIKIK